MLFCRSARSCSCGSWAAGRDTGTGRPGRTAPVDQRLYPPGQHPACCLDSGTGGQHHRAETRRATPPGINPTKRNEQRGGATAPAKAGSTCTTSAAAITRRGQTFRRPDDPHLGQRRRPRHRRCSGRGDAGPGAYSRSEKHRFSGATDSTTSRRSTRAAQPRTSPATRSASAEPPTSPPATSRTSPHWQRCPTITLIGACRLGAG